jgi:UDP-N-acetylmuramoyl-L-alanyl-D-glutamate--2,6-diaminopimelate ligase
MVSKEFLKKIVPRFALNAYHFFLAFLGALLYGFPSRNLIVIGVTGTNGKSTVVEMCLLFVLKLTRTNGKTI